MAPPSQLAIATSSLQRLIKEEVSYHKELEQQQRSVARLEKDESAEVEGEEGNREFRLKQEKQALAETQAIFPSLNERIASAKENLESLLEQEGVTLHTSSAGESEEVKGARKVLTQLKMGELMAGEGELQTERISIN